MTFTEDPFQETTDCLLMAKAFNGIISMHIKTIKTEITLINRLCSEIFSSTICILITKRRND